MNKVYKVGVVGVGGIARTHMPGWRASEHTEVVAFCDTNAEVLHRWADEFAVGRRYPSYEDLIQDAEVDIVDICVPNAYHAPVAVAALKAGKHVLCEKPLAASPEEIRQMIGARDESGQLLMTAQHFRFGGSAKAMKAEISAGVLGDIYHARSWMLRRYLVPVRPGFIVKEHAGGGACIDIGVHILDLTLWLMGNPRPVSVSGVSRTELAKRPGAFSGWGPAIPPELDVEEFACAFVRFENGATLVLEVSWMLHHKTAGEDMQMWLYGTSGGCQWPSCEFYSANNETRQLYNKALQVTKDANEPHAQQCIEFAQALADGTPSPVPAEQSLQVLTILDGVYRSQSEGREVAL